MVQQDCHTQEDHPVEQWTSDFEKPSEERKTDPGLRRDNSEKVR
jgi:hypothetical protein